MEKPVVCDYKVFWSMHMCTKPNWIYAYMQKASQDWRLGQAQAWTQAQYVNETSMKALVCHTGPYYLHYVHYSPGDTY